MNRKINIVLAPDDNYARHCATVMKSALANAKNPSEVAFQILDGGLSENSKNVISHVLSEYDGAGIDFIEIDKDTFANFPSQGYISVSTWYRFKIASLLPQNIKRVIYLDCDVAVNADLSELFDCDMNGFALMGVKDCLWRKFNSRVGLDENYQYFNAGVIVLNLDYWRANNVEGRLFDFINESEAHIKMMDQSVLNIVLQNEYKSLPLCWNVQYVPPYIEECCYLDDKSEYRAAVANPKIIHYVNRFKPWSAELGWLNPLGKIFMRYADYDVGKANKVSVLAKLICNKFIRKPTFLFRKYYRQNIEIWR